MSFNFSIAANYFFFKRNCKASLPLPYDLQFQVCFAMKPQAFLAK
jgi:hypothetical protein